MKYALLILAILLSNACSWDLVPIPESAIGRVKGVEGTPRLLAGDRYLELGPGSGVNVGDSVITGPSDKVTIDLRDGTLIRIGHDAGLTIQAYAGRGETAGLRLASSGGQYRITTGSSFRRVTEGLEVSTPFATLSAGKADLLVEHASDATSLTVLQLGSEAVKVSNQFGEAELKLRGETTRVGFGLSPSAPARLVEGEVRFAIEGTTPGTGTAN